MIPRGLRTLAGSLYWAAMDLLPDGLAVRLTYLRVFHRLPDLTTPRSLTEKLNWRKLYQRDPRFTVFSDKVRVKEEVARIIGPEHVIPTLWAGTDPAAIPFAELEPPYLLKVSHGSGGHIFVRDRADVDEAAIVAQLRSQLAHDHSHRFREWGYRDIPRQVLVERMLDENGAAPTDYKFFVFHGRAVYLEVHRDRFVDHTEDFFDRDLNPVPCVWGDDVKNSATPIVMPESLPAMFAMAERLGRDFDFVRVDLYAVSAGVFFGEMTFYPSAGILRFVPSEWDERFGEHWHLESSRG